MKLTSNDLREIAQAMDKLQAMPELMVKILTMHNKIQCLLERQDSQLDGTTLYLVGIDMND